MEEASTKPKTKKRAVTDDCQQPVHVVAIGNLAAHIYLRQAPSGYGYYAYNVKRSYRSLTTGNPIQSTDFFAENRVDLIAVVTEASEWITNVSEPRREQARNADFATSPPRQSTEQMP